MIDLVSEVVKFDDIINFNALYLKRQYDLGYEDFLDLKQEGYLHLIKYANSYQDKGYTFKHFCNVISKRYMRRYVFTKILAKKNINDELNLDISSDDDKFDLIEKQLDIYKLIDTIDFDTKEDKIAFIFKLEGDKNIDIGKVLNMSSMQVKRSLDKTIKRVQNILNIKECC